MRIGIFFSLRDHIIELSPIYQALLNKGYKTMVFDIEEEKGWFEKGLQYVSLNYDKPNEIISLKNNLIEFYKYFQDLIEKKRLDIILFSGYTDILFTLAYAGKSLGVPVLHVGSGLRAYSPREEEFLRQVTDHIIPYHYTFLPEHTNNLLKENFDPRNIQLIGFPLTELVKQMLPYALNRSTILKEIDVGSRDYISVFLGKKSTLHYMKELKNFSLNSGEYLIIPLNKVYKKYLMEEKKYYELMNEFDILFLETLDYFDHLNFIFNSKAVITDMEWVALEGVMLKKPVTFLRSKDNSLLMLRKDLINVVLLNKELSKNLSHIYKKMNNVYIEKYYGAGESSQIFIDSLNSFIKSSLIYPSIELYIKKGSSLTKLDEKFIPKRFREVLKLK